MTSHIPQGGFVVSLKLGVFVFFVILSYDALNVPDTGVPHSERSVDETQSSSFNGSNPPCKAAHNQEKGSTRHSFSGSQQLAPSSQQ